MDAHELTTALKGKWQGAYASARCPAHGDKSPSLSISIGRDGRTLVKCHSGCTQEQVLDELRRRGLWGGDVTASNLRPFTPTPSRNQDWAFEIWAEAKPAQGTLVEKYLAARGITIPIPETLRFHPALKHPDGGIWPGMVALVTRGPTGTPIAIHRTFLKKDGSGKAPVPRPKMMLGPCGGGAVFLAEAGERLGVGEGIETCLSVQQEVEVPVWAALSTSGLRKLELPPIVRAVTILADADAAGEEAALEAGRRWKAAGLVAKIARPKGGADFNDMLRAKGAAK
jgi:putative DNA primase/helicase